MSPNVFVVTLKTPAVTKIHGVWSSARVACQEANAAIKGRDDATAQVERFSVDAGDSEVIYNAV